MAIVRYHSVGASNTGKVRPAPYKYANPTDLTIAPSVPLQITSGNYDDFFFGTGGDRGKRDEFGRTRKSRREHFDKLADYYNRCSENGARFDPSFVDDLPIFTLEQINANTGDLEEGDRNINSASVVTYNFSSSQYADKSAVWCKKPYWMFETIAHDVELEDGPPEGWYDFRFENTQDPDYGVDPKEGVDGAEANLKQIRKGILEDNGLKTRFKNPEQVYKRISSLRGDMSDAEVNDLLLNASVHPRFDLAYAEFAKFLLPQTGVQKYMKEYGSKSLSEIYLPDFEEYQQQLRDYVGEARTPDGPQKVACFLDYDIAGASYPPIDTTFLESKEEQINGETFTVYETKNFDNDSDFNKMGSIELGPNLWPPRDDVHADADDKWPARGINEERFQFKMVADASSPTAEDAVVSEMVWEPLNPNFKRFEEGLKQEIGFGIAVDLAASKIKKSDFYKDYVSDHRDTMPSDPDDLEQKAIKKSLKLPILGKAKGKNKLKVPAMAYQMDAIAFDSSRLETLSKEQSIGVNQGSSFDKGLNFIFSGPDVFGVPTKKPWKDRVDAMAKELGFVWDDTDGQTWNDVTFMSGVPYVEFANISSDLNITVKDVDKLVEEATGATIDGIEVDESTPTNETFKFSYVEGSEKNESKEAGLSRLAFSDKLLSKNDVLLSYINYGQKDSMDAGDPPGGHDGRGDKTTFNGYGLLNGFGGDDKIYSIFASNLSYGGDGDDQLTGLDKFYDRLFGERGDDIMISMGQDVMDGGSGNDHYFVGIEPRLLVPTPNMDASNLITLGTETDPAEEMSNFVAIEHFDIPGLTHDHKDLEPRDDENVKPMDDVDYADKLYIDKDHLMARFGLQYDSSLNYNNPSDKEEIERQFYSAPRMGFTMNTIKNLDTDNEIGSSLPDLISNSTFDSARSAYPASFYLWLGKEDFKGRNGGADPLIERYLSLDLTWDFQDENDARSFRESESIARFSDLRPEELSDINTMWDENWDDIYSQFGKTNPMHRKLMAQSIAELNPDYEPFKPYLDELYDNVYPRWKGDGCDVVNWDKDYDETWEQPNRYEVIRKYNPGRTPVLPVEGNGGLNLDNLEPLVNEFAWDLWDARREEVMDRIELVESPIPVISEIVGF